MIHRLMFAFRHWQAARFVGLLLTETSKDNYMLWLPYIPLLTLTVNAVIILLAFTSVLFIDNNALALVLAWIVHARVEYWK